MIMMIMMLWWWWCYDDDDVMMMMMLWWWYWWLWLYVIMIISVIVIISIIEHIQNDDFLMFLGYPKNGHFLMILGGGLFLSKKGGRGGSKIGGGGGGPKIGEIHKILIVAQPANLRGGTRILSNGIWLWATALLAWSWGGYFSVAGGGIFLGWGGSKFDHFWTIFGPFLDHFLTIFGGGGGGQKIRDLDHFRTPFWGPGFWSNFTHFWGCDFVI
jgi:hypothetical protein